MVGTVIAFSGKGGAGKTTLAAMTLRQLVATGTKPVLAVDADPNATLAMSLGVQVPGTIADLRDRMGQAAQEITEIPKERLLGRWLSELLAEEVGFDVLTMGRPEGPKCYCYVNGLLRRYLKELRGSYAAVVVDCEAGMEYLSRLTVDDVDTLVLVAEATAIGLRSACRIEELADALPVRVGRRILALNKVGQCRVDESAETKLPSVDETVEIAFDDDLLRRCVRGERIDVAAGPLAGQGAAKLARLCVGSTSGRPGQSNVKETRT